MKVEVVVHCGCGAMFDAMVSEPHDQAQAGAYVEGRLEDFWHDHTHSCQDPDVEELTEADMEAAREQIRYEELRDQTRAQNKQVIEAIYQARREIEGAALVDRKLSLAQNGLDRISDLIVYGPGGAPTPPPQSSGEGVVSS